MKAQQAGESQGRKRRVLKITLRFKKKHFNCRNKKNLDLRTADTLHTGEFLRINNLLINSKEGCFLVIDITVISEGSNLVHKSSKPSFLYLLVPHSHFLAQETIPCTSLRILSPMTLKQFFGLFFPLTFGPLLSLQLIFYHLLTLATWNSHL